MKRRLLLVTAVLIVVGPGARRRAEAQQPPLTPQLTISDVLTATEGRTTVTTPAIFAVTLNPPSSQTVTVAYTTIDPSPAQCAPFLCATAGTDYVPTQGTLTFAPGDTVRIIGVPIINHNTIEPSRAFVTLLLNPTNATLAKPAGIGKITNQRLPGQTVECAQEMPGLTGNPVGFVLAADGNFYMTDAFLPKLLMFNPRTQKGADIPLPPGTLPHFCNVGPDGNIWFSSLNDQIGMLDLKTGKVSLFGQGMTPGSVPHVVVPAPDGNLYFSEEGSELIPDPLGRGEILGTGRLGRINPTTHVITEFSAGLPPRNRMHGLTVGPDGNLWVTLEGLDQIARFNLATHTFDQFGQFSNGSNPSNVLAGPDGNLYVTLEDANRLGRYNPRTGEVREFTTSLTPEDGPSLLYFTVGPDRNSLWFTEFLNDRIGVFDIPTETITEIDCGFTPGSGPIGITVGTDNAIWVSEVVLDPRFSGRLARVVPSAIHRFTDANRGYVTSIYRDLLGHDPDSGALAYFTTLLASGRANRFQVAQAVVNSQEARIQAVQRTYLTRIGRAPTADELTTALGLLAAGGGTGQVEVMVMGTLDYFFLRGGASSFGFLSAVSNDMLGPTPNLGDSIPFFLRTGVQGQPFGYIPLGDVRRAPLPADAPGQLGLEMAPEGYPATLSSAQAAGGGSSSQTTTLNQLKSQLDAGGSRSSAATALVFSQQHDQKLVQTFFGGFLFRPASTSDVTPYVTALEQGVTPETVLASIVATDEYRDRRVLARP